MPLRVCVIHAFASSPPAHGPIIFPFCLNYFRNPLASGMGSATSYIERLHRPRGSSSTSGNTHLLGAYIAACGASVRRDRSVWVPNTRACARQRDSSRGRANTARPAGAAGGDGCHQRSKRGMQCPSRVWEIPSMRDPTLRTDRVVRAPSACSPAVRPKPITNVPRPN